MSVRSFRLATRPGAHDSVTPSNVYRVEKSKTALFQINSEHILFRKRNKMFDIIYKIVHIILGEMT